MIQHSDSTDPDVPTENGVSVSGQWFGDENRPVRFAAGGAVRAPDRRDGPPSENDTGLLVGGTTRLYWLPALADPSAPTRAELEGGIDIGTVVEPGLAITADETRDEEWQLPCAPITLMIRANVTHLVRALRTLRKISRKIERARQQEHPRRTALHADYARRRKARNRRR